MLNEFFSVFGVVILAAGSAGAVLMALLVWVERAWTHRVREREFAEINMKVAETQAELTGNYKRHKEEMARLAANCSDAMRRKRDIYTQLATTMRLLVQSGNAADKRYLNEFLASCDVAYMWAAEPVIAALREFREALIDRDAVEDLYRKCLMEMRKDCGFPEPVTSQSMVRGKVYAAPNQL